MSRSQKQDEYNKVYNQLMKKYELKRLEYDKIEERLKHKEYREKQVECFINVIITINNGVFVI